LGERAARKRRVRGHKSLLKKQEFTTLQCIQGCPAWRDHVYGFSRSAGSHTSQKGDLRATQGKRLSHDEALI
jgi:hypothetical protein